MYNYDEFDRESEEEIEEMLDAAIEYIGEAITPRAGAVNILNVQRAQHVDLCAAVLKRFVVGNDIEFECEMNKPVTSSAYISLTGKKFSLDDTRWIARVGSLANNMEIYPLTDGRVRMTFMFYGLTEEIG